MKKLIMLLLALMFVFTSTCFAADWSKYESGRNNIRLSGYQSQPGYIAFEDGDGTVLGYMWMSTGKGLVWCSATSGTSYTLGSNSEDYQHGMINLENTKLTNSYGVAISRSFDGSITGHSY